MRRMRVALVGQPWNHIVPPALYGSVEIWIYEVARRLAKHCDVTVYSRLAAGQRSRETFEGVEYRRFSVTADRRCHKLMKLFTSRKRGERISEWETFYLLYALKVAWDIRKRKMDVVQVFNVSQFVRVIRALNPETRIALRMSCEWLVQLDKLLVQRRLAAADLIIGCSDFISSQIREVFPQVMDRCVTVHNARDVHHFRPAEEPNPAMRDANQLLYVGRVSPEKGVHVLVEAFVGLARRYPRLRLRVVGSAASTAAEFIKGVAHEPHVIRLAPLFECDYLAHLKSVVPDDIKGRVEFLPPVPHRQLVHLYREADIFVFPSIINEAGGNPPIEAMASGVPVVSTCTGGTPEYVEEGKTGLLVGPADAKSLAGSIARLLEDAKLRKAMGEAARARAVQLFSFERLTEDMLHHYRKLCGWCDASGSREAGCDGCGTSCTRTTLGTSNAGDKHGRTLATSEHLCIL